VILSLITPLVIIVISAISVIMMSSGEEEVIVSDTSFISFNQDTSCVVVGTNSGYHLYSINSTDTMDLVHKNDEPDVYIAERLFSSSLVAVVSTTNPRTLRVCHFKKRTEICRYSYNDKIRAVRMNRSVGVNTNQNLYSKTICSDLLFAWRRACTSTTSAT